MSQNQLLALNVRERVASLLMPGVHSRESPIPMLPPLRELTMVSATFASMLFLERLRICASMQQHALRATLMPSWLLGHSKTRLVVAVLQAVKCLLQATLTSTNCQQARTKSCSVCCCWLSSWVEFHLLLWPISSSSTSYIAYDPALFLLVRQVVSPLHMLQPSLNLSLECRANYAAWLIAGWSLWRGSCAACCMACR